MLHHAAVLPLLLLVAAGASSPPAAAPRSAFVVGAPGRLAGAGDRRLPRLRPRVESSVSAYADVEQVDDPTWLAHEVESYVRRAATCTAVGADWCRREVRQIGGAAVIFFATGAHAEVAWVAGGNRAVRLGWTRIVNTPAGTMTVDEPPADMMDPLLDELPSDLAPFSFDAARERLWAASEVDRLVYYIDQAAAGLPALEVRDERWHAIDFVAGNLARIARLRAPGVERSRDDGGAPQSSRGLPASLAEELEAVRAWRSGAGPQSAVAAAVPWCALLP
ncbi:MAG: hypothetical protein ACRERC_15370, partial [Candidatus Binatia bacterium]